MKSKSLLAQNALIESFIFLISKLGAHHVTLQKTAKHAKIPFSTAHYYYGGDGDLIFKDAVQFVGTKAQSFIAKYLEKHSTFKSNPVELYITGTFAWILTFQNDSRLWLFNYYFSSLKSDFAEVQEAIVDTARLRVLNILFEAKGKGFYPALKVTPEVAEIVHTLIFGLGIMAMTQSIDAKKVIKIRTKAVRDVNHVLKTASSLF